MTWKTGDADEFLEDIMTKHVCEWLIGWEPEIGEILARCERISVCDASMGLDEIEARLNATERLSAADAREAARLITSPIGAERFSEANALDAYANILEGKDD